VPRALGQKGTDECCQGEPSRGQKGVSRAAATVAFHFRFVMPGQYVCNQTVAVDRLTRVLRAIRADLRAGTGTVSIRMGQLFYTQDLGGDLELDWWGSIFGMPVMVGGTTFRAHLDDAVPLDRILVVSVSGDLAGRLDLWSRRVEEVAGDRFLFALAPRKGRAGSAHLNTRRPEISGLAAV